MTYNETGIIVCLFMDNKRSRQDERAILLQGVDPAASQPVAAGSLPLAQEKPVAILNGSSTQKHQNTVGQVHLIHQGDSLLNIPVVPWFVYYLSVQAQYAQLLHIAPAKSHISRSRHAKDHSVVHQ